MQKHYLKFPKFFTNIAFSPLILISNNSELAAMYMPNEADQSIINLEINNIKNGLFRGVGIKEKKNFFIAENKKT